MLVTSAPFCVCSVDLTDRSDETARQGARSSPPRATIHLSTEWTSASHWLRRLLPGAYVITWMPGLWIVRAMVLALVLFFSGAAWRERRAGRASAVGD